jgi:transposase
MPKAIEQSVRELKIIQLRTKQHKSIRTIINTLKCSKYTVMTALKRHREGTLNQKWKTTGRPLSISNKSLEKTIKQKRNATSLAISKRLHQEYGQTVSSQTIRRRRRKIGFRKRKTKIKQKSTPKIIRETKQFIAKMKDKPINFCVFDDESSILLCNTNDYGYYLPDEPVSTRNVSEPRSMVKLYGIISSGCKHIVTYKGKFNRYKYIELLDKVVAPRARSFHQHFFITDNSSVHKTRLVNAWFENHNIHRVFLPTYRPQYNAIESVWHEIKYRVKRSEPTSHASLQRAAIDAIDDVSMTTIRKHIHHVRTEINNTTVEI